MPRISQEWQDNTSEQNAIELAFLEAIPDNCKYYNICIALTKLLARYVRDAWADEVATEPVNKGEGE